MTRTDYENILIGLCMWREARGTSDDAKLGVLWVILNRVHSGKYGKGVTGVILRPKQFSSFNLGEVQSIKFPTPNVIGDWLAFERCMELVEAPGVSDPTSGATHYYDDSISPPNWADPLKFTCQIGPFRFFKLT